MININTDKNLILDKFKIINFNNEFFNFKTASGLLSALDIHVIKVIDNGRVYDDNFHVETPFGVCDLISLSTVCKTIINILNNLDMVVNINKCSPNAFKYIILSFAFLIEWTKERNKKWIKFREIALNSLKQHGIDWSCAKDKDFIKYAEFFINVLTDERLCKNVVNE